MAENAASFDNVYVESRLDDLLPALPEEEEGTAGQHQPGTDRP